MKLSILIPSNRPEGLDAFLDSLCANTRVKEDVEVVILVDSPDKLDGVDENFVEFKSYKGIRTVIIHRKPTVPLNISTLQYECLKVSSGEWIMLGNDDCLVQTKNWDDQIRHAMEYYPDHLALVYPNDGMFGQVLACFPIISRKLIDLVELFPMPYHRYKVDDTIFQIMPPGRRLYLPNCLFTHLNDKAAEGEGYKLPSGKIYPINREFGDLDQQLWEMEASRRSKMMNKLNHSLGVKPQKVLIGVPTVEMARRAVFYDYLNLLEKPLGTIMTMAHGQSPAKNRNMIIEQGISNQCTHILFIDDDMTFDPDLLNRLLAHDKDIVTALYMMRNYPHRPLIFDIREKDGSCRQYFPRDDEHGLIKIVNAGMGAVLIKIEVFLKMQKPWVTLGELTKDDWCDDISFFNRARDLGFEMYCDLDCLCGHMAGVTIKPQKINNAWHITYDTTGEGTVSFPIIRPPVEMVAK